MRAGEARRIGLVSDTHGMVRPELFQALDGVELILHAGDVGPDEILEQLGMIAPVHAVYGNTDAPGRRLLREAIDITVDGVRIHVSHGHEVGSPSPERLAAKYDADVIVFGHTHRQLVARIGEQLIVNPGAAGARRFDLQPSAAVLTIADGRAAAALVPLAAG
ncbi:MAG TPA: metallophosphoesterase family protein [Gemmatimonadaceae bacterium]|nr:metallophosphoesterase family protein [Gemmatimonadaceae bacterium]